MSLKREEIDEISVKVSRTNISRTDALNLKGVEELENNKELKLDVEHLGEVREINLRSSLFSAFKSNQIIH